MGQGVPVNATNFFGDSLHHIAGSYVGMTGDSLNNI